MANILDVKMTVDYLKQLCAHIKFRDKMKWFEQLEFYVENNEQTVLALRIKKDRRKKEETIYIVHFLHLIPIRAYECTA